MNINNEEYRAGFAEHYAEGRPVWDIGKPQAPFIEIADQVKGPVLDVGCGTGSAALFFASRGLEVTGIDLVDEAIRRAEKKVAEQAASVEFLVKDAFTLADWDRRFATIIDSGLFHVFAEDELRRSLYGAVLGNVLQPGGYLYLMASKKQDDGAVAMPGMTLGDLHNTFADGWNIESVKEFQAEVTPETLQQHPGATWMTWCAIIRKM